ncbi:hypothetical protein E0765_03345 [Sulfuricurvum sp. IAE1]|uniref:hypothetical protein n=1 Tax=Sulfuricurvum sp. IAE1 TaxID=2546102 RepID=UPI001042D866|nr:hypothetical protein [Sulfuricurvum sp. IAE1]TDA68382.1 hypothetical protein E0765_03345 [Sulfuricurvum sp. IAE1]
MMKIVSGFLVIGILSSNVFAGCFETAQTGWNVGLGVRGGAMNEQHAMNMCQAQISVFRGEAAALQIAYEACVAAATGGSLQQVITKHCQ